MDPYASEKEQIEALRSWWRGNGKAVVVGVILGLGVLFGWRAWQSYHHVRAGQASMEYAQMSVAVAAAKDDQARQWAAQIIADFATTPYAPLAAFTLARLDVEKGDLKAAQARLKWAVDHAGDRVIRAVARLRLARVLLSEGQPQAAWNVIRDVQPGGFAASYDQLRGDLYMAQKDSGKAHAAYQQALKELGPDAAPEERALLEMKVGSLGSEAHPAPKQP
ncbi:MAG: hypothetical protein B7Z66_05625 [Chromatiales bacterium 21-64-14]|nr:MAG: hypothetical protein B7Z66_05625 [Chromatiales bacterium 21-64-14]HQU15029.1 tetratricopeptide repeat protein [Gammaproteobacteria bacterium]